MILDPQSELFHSSTCLQVLPDYVPLSLRSPGPPTYRFLFTHVLRDLFALMRPYSVPNDQILAPSTGGVESTSADVDDIVQGVSFSLENYHGPLPVWALPVDLLLALCGLPVDHIPPPVGT